MRAAVVSELARIVQLGQSAGEYARLVEHATNGDIQVEIERHPLDRVADAWEQQATSPHRKLVLIP